MKATKAYSSVTARTIGGQIHDWLLELVERFGDDRVAAAIEEDGKTGKPPEKMLGRVRDRLAKEDAMRQPRIAPPEYTGRDMLAVARGERPMPPRPFIYDLRVLSSEEYTELLSLRAKF